VLSSKGEKRAKVPLGGGTLIFREKRVGKLWKAREGGGNLCKGDLRYRTGLSNRGRGGSRKLRRGNELPSGKKKKLIHGKKGGAKREGSPMAASGLPGKTSFEKFFGSRRGEGTPNFGGL